jgi:hypothetical protein
MCRFVAYLGQPTYLEELIARPRHSLLRQSLRAEEAKTVTNGDGFGIGWYGERPEPAVYREVMPAWSDDNLLALSGTLRSHLFFAHVRAATSGGIARSNCHPFRWRRWLFMHNGQRCTASARRTGHHAPERRAHAAQRQAAGGDQVGDQRGLAAAPSSFIATARPPPMVPSSAKPATASTSSFGKAAIRPTTAPPTRPSTM